MTTLLCPHCNAQIPVDKATEGWCEACSKPLPAHLMAAAARTRRLFNPPKAESCDSGYDPVTSSFAGSKATREPQTVAQQTVPILGVLAGIGLAAAITYLFGFQGRETIEQMLLLTVWLLAPMIGAVIGGTLVGSRWLPEWGDPAKGTREPLTVPILGVLAGIGLAAAITYFFGLQGIPLLILWVLAPMIGAVIGGTLVGLKWLPEWVDPVKFAVGLVAGAITVVLGGLLFFSLGEDFAHALFLGPGWPPKLWLTIMLLIIGIPGLLIWGMITSVLDYIIRCVRRRKQGG